MIHTDKTIKAKNELEKITGIPVKILSLDDFSKKFDAPYITSYFGVYNRLEEEHIIGINLNKPNTNESTFVHECCHAIMNHLGYPKVDYMTYPSDGADFVSLLHRISSNLSSVIQHPKVYYMMENDFEIDMENYFKGLLLQKCERLKKSSKEFELEKQVFNIQQNIIDGMEYFYYDDETRKTILSQLSITCPNSYNFLIGLKKAKYNFLEIKESKKSANDLLARIKKYGEKRTESKTLNNIWDRILIN